MIWINSTFLAETVLHCFVEGSDGTRVFEAITGFARKGVAVEGEEDGRNNWDVENGEENEKETKEMLFEKGTSFPLKSSTSLEKTNAHVDETDTAK